MKVLVLGGTGAMGKPLIQILADRGFEVDVTSRRRINSTGKINYIMGDAHNIVFLQSILQSHYDAIVDFMLYEQNEFESRIEILLKSTDQYVFISSSRVYSDSNFLLTEESDRLLDVCEDNTFLASNGYALQKAKEEDTLIQSGKKNWTIIRPYMTYNTERLQLGSYEKEYWLYRCLHNRTIVFSRDIASKITTLTYGNDVALIIAALIGKKTSLGEVINTTTNQSITWEKVLEIYLTTIHEITGVCPKVKWVETVDEIEKVMGTQFQIRYDRIYNRAFDISKLRRVCENVYFTETEEGLRCCIIEFFNSRQEFKPLIARWEAYVDRITGEKTSLQEFNGVKEKVKYLLFRYTPYLRLKYHINT